MKAVKGKNLDTKRVEELIARTDFLVAHNVSFDGKMVTQLFPSALEKKWYCSMTGQVEEGRPRPPGT